MGIQTAVDVLARMLDGYGSGERSIRHVGARTAGGGDALEVELEVPVEFCRDGDTAGAGAPVGAALSDDGALAVEFSTDQFTEVPSTPEADVTTSPRSARVCDGEVLLTVEATITPTDDGGEVGTAVAEPGTVGERREPLPRVGGGADHDDERAPGADASTGSEADSHPDTTADVEAVRDESVPPYEDVEYLRALYDRFDTFSEMREAFELDVSTETVRRYMIDEEVHDPTSYETTAAAPAGSQEDRDAGGGHPIEPSAGGETTDPAAPIPDERLVTDGIGLSDDLALDDILDAVMESSTVYEVTRTLQLDQRRTREILEQLGLLDLVMHRVSDDRNRDLTYEEVVERLRQSAASA